MRRCGSDAAKAYPPNLLLGNPPNRAKALVHESQLEDFGHSVLCGHRGAADRLACFSTSFRSPGTARSRNASTADPAARSHDHLFARLQLCIRLAILAAQPYVTVTN